MDHLDVIARAGALRLHGVGLDWFLMPDKVKKNPKLMTDALWKNNLGMIGGFGIPFALPALALTFFKDQEKRFFQLATDLGVQTLRVVGGVVVPIKGFKPIHLSLSKAEELKTVSRNLKNFSQKAKARNMKVALEYHMDYTADQMLNILEAVGEPNFGFTLDTGNALHVGENPLQVARKLAPYTLFTHIKDMKMVGNHAECVALGEGEVPLTEILQVLSLAGYQGYYCLENALKPAERDMEQEMVVRGVQWLQSAFKNSVA